MENIEAMLCAYVEGDLDAAGRAQIEKHLQDHPQHRKLMEDLIAMRDMMRSLPRVKAPVDVGESLRGQVERSILLDDSVGRDEPSEPGSRWPQFMAIAAILLLCVSLGLVLYKALGPTMKPPVFTDNSAPKSHDLQPIDNDLQTAAASPAMSQPSTTDLLANDNRVAGLMNTKTPGSGPLAAQMQQPYIDSLLQNQAANFSPVDFIAIRQRLQNSGYDVAGVNDKTASPVLMVVNSTDPPATNEQIAQFLSNSKGISWKLVPADVETKQMPATQPTISGDGSEANSPPPGMSIGNGMGNEQPSIPTPATQPSSDVYVANGLTAEQADALRQSLSAKQQSGAQVQVSLQSAAMLATTQPSDSTVVKPADANDTDLFHAASATQPTVSESALPTTIPSNSNFAGGNGIGGGAEANANAPAALSNNNLLEQNNSHLLQQVDAVIVIQSTPPVPTTQPAPIVTAPAPVDSTPATQPAPSTQP